MLDKPEMHSWNLDRSVFLQDGKIEIYCCKPNFESLISLLIPVKDFFDVFMFVPICG